MEPFSFFACLIFINVEQLRGYTPDNIPKVFKVFHAFSNLIPSFVSHCRHTDYIDLVPQT